uniref:Kinesin-like protein n=1 Tax=Denticeps clupeoides TaxID=299321 RepID=A0AAY4BUK9_9TELE
MAGTEVCSHIRVVVRVRPPNSKEGGMKRVVQVVDKHMLVFDPKEEEVTFFRGQRSTQRDLRKRVPKDLKFVFDTVFGESSTQAEVFDNTTKGIVDSVLNGYNCSVFAYGATGAGKTHTMLGSGAEPGVMYHTMRELFTRMDQIKDEKVFDVAFSYLEVYNEQIRDLLANSGPLAVREDGNKGVVVQGLSLQKPTAAEHILEALDHGNRNRTQHPTDVNASSSRSHAVFQIYLRQQDKTASLNPNVRVAKMSLIDLAGSERASATNANGPRFREGANINRSLLALGNVINTLADPKSKKAHVPYRDSKLTRLLKDSLGGNCRTVMIANISPSSGSYEDTLNTLKYANRAKEIKTSLKSNVVSLDSHVGQYVVICERQRAEDGGLCEECVRGPHGVAPEQLETERQLKENELRQRHREDAHLQRRMLILEYNNEKATSRYEHKLASLRSLRQHLQERLKAMEMRFQENDDWLHRVENEMKLLGEAGHAPEVLQQELGRQWLKLQVEDVTAQLDHAKQLVVLQDQENKRTRKLVNALLPAYRRQYAALQDAGGPMDTYAAERERLEHLVLRERGVAWADQDGAEGQEGETLVPDPAHLQPLLSFSHLVLHQSTPCSEFVSNLTWQLFLSTTLKEPVPTKAPIRRKLNVEPAAGSAAPLRPPQDVLEACKQDCMFPLQYTPDHAQKPPPGADLNGTFDVGGSEESSGANGAVALNIPSLLDIRHIKPSYMAMTSAASGKRKLNCESASDGLNAAKRVKQDVGVTAKPLRVSRVEGEAELMGFVPRTVAGSNLELITQRVHLHYIYGIYITACLA